MTTTGQFDQIWPPVVQHNRTFLENRPCSVENTAEMAKINKMARTTDSVHGSSVCGCGLPDFDCILRNSETTFILSGFCKSHIENCPRAFSPKF